MNKQKILEIASKYYRRNDVIKSLINYAKNREIVAKYWDRFGKRPDTLEYENDVKVLINKGLTSFHCSVELWKDPLRLSTQLSQKELEELRIGWDLLIDIDCKWFDYSRETARLIIDALEWHGIRNYGIKFSGNKGFHLVLSYKAFPIVVKGIKIKNFFPEGTRLITNYLADFIEKDLREFILSLNTLAEIKKATNKKEEDLFLNGKFNPYVLVSLDSMLMASRHLYRMPYSLHEKTGLVSTVLNKHQLKTFKPEFAKPFKISIEDFLKEPKPNEAKELLLNTLDWQVKEFIPKIETRVEYKEFKPLKVKALKVKDVEKDISFAFCDCIKKILEGIKTDGRKRALFILITFFRSIGWDWERIEKTIEEWNKKNYRPLGESYIKGQLNWFKKQTKTLLPPNHNSNLYYKDIGIFSTSCSNFKNPFSFTLAKLKQKNEKIKNEKIKGKNKRKKE